MSDIWKQICFVRNHTYSNVSYVICKVIGIGADAGFVIPWGALIIAIAGVFLVVFDLSYTLCAEYGIFVGQLKMM